MRDAWQSVCLPAGLMMNHSDPPHGGPDRISPRLLNYFLAVAEELSFSRAAQRLHISQPPLSQHIKQLEAQLGARLFLRSTRRVELTEAGALLLREMRQVHQHTQRSLQQVSQIGRGLSGLVRIGLVGSAAWGELLPALRRLGIECPGLQWSFEELKPDQQLEALLQHRIDLGLWREAPAAGLPPLLESRLIQTEALRVALPGGHRLLKRHRGPLSLQALTDEAFVWVSSGPHGLGSYLARSLPLRGLVPRSGPRVQEPQTALALVAAGYGVTLLPERYARIGWPGVGFRALREDLRADLYAVFHRQSSLAAVHTLLRCWDQVPPACDPGRDAADLSE